MGALCSDLEGAVCSGQVGALSSGQMGAVTTEFPPVGTFSNSAPSCSGSGLVTVTLDMGSSKTKTYTLKVKDEYDNQQAIRTFDTDAANECKVFQVIP